MPIDFKYVPTSGDLSGKSFEQQTEHALNELGAEIDSVKETTDEASAVAQNAQAASTSAVNTADAAVGTAQAANQAAQTAIQTANSATLIAQGASEQSQSAYDLASSAKAKAESAENSAQTAIDIAQNAENTAETTEENVIAISVIAENAQSTAETALALAKGIYKTTDARIDADEEVQAKMLYITNPVSLNFPVATPVFFSVYPTDDGTMAVQFCYASGETTGFSRVSVSLNINPALNVWGEWITSKNAKWVDIANKPTTFMPTVHKTTHSTSGTDALTPADIGAATAIHSLPLSTTTVAGHARPGTGMTVDTAGALAVTYGTSAGSACVGNDARLSNTRTPTAHKHVAADITSGVLPIANGGTGAATAAAALTALGAVATTDARLLFGAPDGARSTILTVPTSTSKYTMPYDGFICVQLYANFIIGYQSTLMVGGHALVIVSWDGASNTVRGRSTISVHKGTSVWTLGGCELFQVFKLVGAA